MLKNRWEQKLSGVPLGKIGAREKDRLDTPELGSRKIFHAY